MCHGKKGQTSCCGRTPFLALKMRDLGESLGEATWQVEGMQILGCPTTHSITNDELQAFQLVGNRYQAMESMAGRIWMPDLENWAVHCGRESTGALRR